MKPLSNQRIAAILGEYLIATETGLELADAIRLYISLLLQWNRSISLTTVTDPEEIVRFHFGESLFAASVYQIRSGRLADVGSGAGFPGLPLKMLSPAINLTLIESNAKKAAFLSEVVRRLQLEDVRVFRGRMEEFGGKEKFDFVAARALGRFEALLTWSQDRLATAGKLILWVGGDDAKTVSRLPGWTWSVPEKIPQSRRRFVLSGSRK